MNQQKSVAAKIELSEIKPKISEAELKTTKAAAEKYVASEVSITAGKRTISADKPTRVNWISFENNKAVLNEAALKNGSPISLTRYRKSCRRHTQCNQFRECRRNSQKAQAEEKVTNFDEVFKTIKDNLQKGQNTQAALNVEVGTETWKDRIIAPGAENLTYKATVGEKWIDVNLSTFKMTAYEGATRVRGPITVVTGESETPTITGKYKIWHKTKVQDMRGTHPDGTEYHAKTYRGICFSTETMQFTGHPGGVRINGVSKVPAAV
ncbi:L,D-transpeptidase [Arcanobacterium hippocoleae]